MEGVEGEGGGEEGQGRRSRRGLIRRTANPGR